MSGGPFVLTLVTALGCGLVSSDRPLALLLAGAGLYLAGNAGVTMAFNVTLNNRLAALEPQAGDSASLWDDYLTRWTAWNHVRTVTALAAATVLTIALTE